MPTRALGDPGQLARALGWFSIGLGVAEVAAPGVVSRLIGIAPDGRRHPALRAMGLREIATGAGILTRRRPADWLRGRVVGDVVDLALLAAAWRTRGAHRGRFVTATTAVAGVTALDALCARALREGAGSAAARGIHVRKAITVNRSQDEVYRYWRDFQNLPRFMKHLESVQPRPDGRWHWTAKGPAGATVEWDAELTAEEPPRRIAWRSLAGSTVRTAGSVRFDPAPGGRGTEVHVELDYDPPAGRLGATVAWLFGRAPEQEVQADLRTFKQVLETGEIATARGPTARTRPSRSSGRSR
ncbi:MAG TPA: SRPBCC family protein [Candidatus Binatia bacterium]|nr:SRPBCC family protein [Candidatus Binatia bacterium]